MAYKPTARMCEVLRVLHAGGYITNHSNKFWLIDAYGHRTWLRDNTYFGLSEHDLIHIEWKRDLTDDKLYRHDTLTALGRAICE